MVTNVFSLVCISWPILKNVRASKTFCPPVRFVCTNLASFGRDLFELLVKASLTGWTRLEGLMPKCTLSLISQRLLAPSSRTRLDCPDAAR